MADQKNLLLAILLSVAIMVGYQYFFAPEQTPMPEADTQAEDKAQTAPNLAPSPTLAPGTRTVPVAPGGMTPDSAVTLSDGAPRLKIDSARVSGSMSLRGGRIEDLLLKNYRETLEADSANIVVLSPKGSGQSYFAQFGWVADEATPASVPDENALWSADRTILKPGAPVTLSWDNGAGLIFKRVIGLDENYMFSFDQTVENYGRTGVTLYPYGLLSRDGTPETTGFYILHEGLLGVFDTTLDETDYEDVQEEKTKVFQTTGGWIGITDKYWLAALVPDQSTPITARYVYDGSGGADRYQTDFLGSGVSVSPGSTVTANGRLFVGAKEVHLLDRYADDLGIVNFDLAIDFGWFYWITKPLFLALLWLNNYVGNLGVAILLLTVGIKLAFFPLANKSYRAMSKMKKLQPEVKKLQEKYKEDKARLNQEMMALYKKEKANPAAGCLPVLIQIPVFFALYKVLFVTIEMRHAPFFGWVKDLSAPDPTSIFNLFGLIPWDPPTFLMIGIWPLIMGASMFLQQKLNPAPADPIQAKLFMFLPVLFTVMLANFPAGLVIYWAWNNVLSIAQQWAIMKRMGVSA